MTEPERDAASGQSSIPLSCRRAAAPSWRLASPQASMHLGRGLGARRCVTCLTWPLRVTADATGEAAAHALGPGPRPGRGPRAWARPGPRGPRRERAAPRPPPPAPRPPQLRLLVIDRLARRGGRGQAAPAACGPSREGPFRLPLRPPAPAEPCATKADTIQLTISRPPPGRQATGFPPGGGGGSSLTNCAPA